MKNLRDSIEMMKKNIEMTKIHLKIGTFIYYFTVMGVSLCVNVTILAISLCKVISLCKSEVT